MSFLLRKPARGAPAASRAPQSHRGVSSKSKQSRPPTLSSSSSSSRSSGGMQQQQLLQRRPAATQQQRVAQSNKNKSQQVSKETQQELQGVISMEEVMEDLRVLEQQQLDSQRKLAAIKLTKQHKQSQHSSLESKLSSIKYANGEQRAQLVRARDVLSRGTREMGATKLSSAKSSDDLKGFDSGLKKAFVSNRILNALRHKVDSGIIVLGNKRTVILRSKTKAMDGVTASTKRTNDVKNHEDSLRKWTRDEKYKTKNLMGNITSARSEVTGLGQDLAKDQSLLDATKFRAECSMSDLVAQDKRHDTVMEEECSKLEVCKQQEAEKTAREQAMAKEIELKQTQLVESWKRCVQLQQEEGHEVSPEPTDDGSTPTLDVGRLQAVLDEEQAALRSDKTERDGVNESLTAEHEEVASLESNDAALLQDVESIDKATDDAQKVETDRQEANGKFLDELEQDRCSVRDLRRSVSELEESIGSERKRLGDRHAEQSETIEKRQTEVKESKAELANALTTLQDLEGRFEENQESNSRLVEKAKRDADSTRSEFEEARLQVEASKNAPDTDIQKEVEDIQQAQSILVEDTKDEIEQLCEEYPALEEIEIDFDADMTTDELADESLADLKAECAARVEQARLEKEAERNKAALKKEKEAEASRKRKEERRNERKRREQAKQQQLNDGKQKRRSRDGAGILAPTQDATDDEPIPASQKTIRFEDEEEIGSLVTNLSTSRSRDKTRAYGKSGRSSAGSSSSLKSKSKAVGKERPSSLKSRDRPVKSSKDSSSVLSKSRGEDKKESSRSVAKDDNRSLNTSKSRGEGKSKKVDSHKSSSLVSAENRSVKKRSKDSSSVSSKSKKDNVRSSRDTKKASSSRSVSSGGEASSSSRSLSSTKKASSSSRSVSSRDKTLKDSSSSSREGKSKKVESRKSSTLVSTENRPVKKRSKDSSSVSSKNKKKDRDTKKRKTRDLDCGASQASGISTGERGGKVRRRKKSGVSASSSKSSKLNAFGFGGGDVDFSF